ncbi:MAG TPA: Nramp family divalent metal transporter [Candidatus Thermoplasmatota archaeon]|nr:Nramp family divalent metal transporter [Candidatus Thermoplasmatota archaeon]
MPDPQTDSDASRRPRWGPGWAVTAAFIGPGTITTMTLAGANYAYTLLWSVALSVLIAVVLQEMSARVAMANGAGLGTVLRNRFQGTPRVVVAALVVVSIFVGNSAFQTGNLAGAALGLQVLADAPIVLWAFIVANAAFLLLWLGRGRSLELFLQAGVAAMCLCFVFTLLVAPVDWIALLRGFVPSMPRSAGVLVLGIIGTTVVPYNFFLHSSLVTKAGWSRDHLGLMRRDTFAAVAVGGIISAAVVATSAAVLAGADVADARTMAEQLRPLLGGAATTAFAVGLFFAGLTSAMTAPFAAAYAVTQVLGGAWTKGGVSGRRFRTIWVVVLVVGLVPLMLDVNPIGAIVAAQALNGVLLPFLAVLLILAANDARPMGTLRNGLATNLAGAAAVAVAFLLGLRLLFGAFGA